MTDERGHPAVTGIAEIDAVPERILKAIMPPFPRARRRGAEARSLGAAAVVRATKAAAPSSPNGKGFVFADFDPDDESGQFMPDDDGDTYTDAVRAAPRPRARRAGRCRRRAAIRS